MPPYVFLAIAAVFLFLVLLAIVGFAIAWAINSLVKGYIAHKRYGLIDRGIDRDKETGLDEITDAIVKIDGDLGWGRSGDHNVDRSRVASTSDENSLPSSEDMLRPRPVLLPPDETFRKK